jgi:hypothetical protein
LARSTSKPLEGSLSSTGALSRSIAKALTGTLTASGDLAASIVGAVVAAVRVVTGIASRILISTGREEIVIAAKDKDPDTDIQR